MAKETIHDGYTNVAAVLACAVLEDTLKRFVGSNDLDITDKQMSIENGIVAI